MVPAVALRKESNFEQRVALPSRGEVLARYRHLRAISKIHHSEALKRLSNDAILRIARRLGLMQGKIIVLGSEDELTLAFDLAIHTAPVGRTRAIDRYARNSPPPPGSDEALVLDAMGNARFGLISVERRHHAAGLVVVDLFRKEEVWLVDEGLEASLPEGTLFATRYFTPDGFSMTAGVGMPFDLVLLADALRSAPQLMRKSHRQALGDPRFAEAIYRTAIAERIMEGMTYQDPTDSGRTA